MLKINPFWIPPPLKLNFLYFEPFTKEILISINHIKKAIKVKKIKGTEQKILFTIFLFYFDGFPNNFIRKMLNGTFYACFCSCFCKLMLYFTKQIGYVVDSHSSSPRNSIRKVHWFQNFPLRIYISSSNKQLVEGSK